MNVSAFLSMLKDKSPAEMQETFIQLYSSMTPERFFEHMKNIQKESEKYGVEKEREEIVCRLLASGMSVEEIACILGVKVSVIQLIYDNNYIAVIPKYEKKLAERRKREQKIFK